MKWPEPGYRNIEGSKRGITLRAATYTRIAALVCRLAWGRLGGAQQEAPERGSSLRCGQLTSRASGLSRMWSPTGDCRRRARPPRAERSFGVGSFVRTPYRSYLSPLSIFSRPAVVMLKSREGFELSMTRLAATLKNPAQKNSAAWSQ